MAGRILLVWPLAGLLAAPAALAQQFPHAQGQPAPGQIAPYVDTILPPPRLPPPREPLERLYPPPARPDPIPDRSAPIPPPYPGGTLHQPRGALPQGFTMTIRREAAPPREGALRRPRDIGERLVHCWRAPGVGGGEVTVRVSFDRQGRVIGAPRVTYLKPGEGVAASDLRASIEAAFTACAPLRFTPDLGSAIAGRPFTFRFIAPGAAGRS